MARRSWSPGQLGLFSTSSGSRSPPAITPAEDEAGPAIISEEVIQNDPAAGRHRGASESTAAHRRLRKFKRETFRSILVLFRTEKDRGLTAKEVAQALDKPLHAVSARITELRTAGLIRKTALKREDSAVHIHRKFF